MVLPACVCVCAYDEYESSAYCPCGIKYLRSIDGGGVGCNHHGVIINFQAPNRTPNAKELLGIALQTRHQFYERIEC